MRTYYDGYKIPCFTSNATYRGKSKESPTLDYLELKEVGGVELRIYEDGSQDSMKVEIRVKDKRDGRVLDVSSWTYDLALHDSKMDPIELAGYLLTKMTTELQTEIAKEIIRKRSVK